MSLIVQGRSSIDSEENWADDYECCILDDDYDRFEDKSFVLVSNKKWSAWRSIISEKGDYSKFDRDHTPRYIGLMENSEGKNLLHLCVEYGNFDAAAVLLSLNFGSEDYITQFLNKKDYINSATPLSKALRKRGSHEIVELLLVAGASYKWNCVTDKSGKLQFGDDKILDTFRKFIYSIDNFSQIVFHLIVKDWKLEDVESLQDQRLAYCARLISAVNQENAKQVRSMLAAPAVSVQHLNIIFREVLQINDHLIVKLFLDQYTFHIRRDINSNYKDMFEYVGIENMLIILEHYPDIKFRRDVFLNEYSYGLEVVSFGELLLETGCLKLRSINGKLRQLLREPKYIFNSFLDETNCNIRFMARLNDLGCRHCIMRDSEYFHKCYQEIKKMKEKKIDDSLTVYDILIKSIDDIIPIIKNDKLMKSIGSDIIKVDFPSFNVIFKFKLDMARRKREWIDQSIDTLSRCLPPIFSGNRFVLERISYFLGLKNLVYLVDSRFV